MEGTISIATIITSIGSILTGFLGWIGDIFTFIIGNPLMLFFVLVTFVPSLVFIGIKIINNRKKKI